MKSLRNPNRKPTPPGAVLREDVLPALGITQARMSLKFNTSGTQVVDFIENGCPIADYKAGLMRFLGVGSANSKAANSDF